MAEQSNNTDNDSTDTKALVLTQNEFEQHFINLFIKGMHDLSLADDIAFIEYTHGKLSFSCLNISIFILSLTQSFLYISSYHNRFTRW